MEGWSGEWEDGVVNGRIEWWMGGWSGGWENRVVDGRIKW